MSTCNIYFDQNISFATQTTWPVSTPAAPALRPLFPVQLPALSFCKKAKQIWRQIPFLSKNSNSQLSVLLPSFSLHFSRCLSSPSRKSETITPLTRYQSPIPLCHQTESCSSKCPGTKSHDYWEDILATKGNAESLKVKKTNKKNFSLAHVQVFLPCVCATSYGNATKFP